MSFDKLSYHKGDALSLPKGWEIKKLGEVCDLQNGFAFKSTDYIEFSNTVNFRMSQIRPGGGVDLENNPKYLPDEYAITYKDYLLKEGDIVIAMTDMATETKILGVPTIVPSDSRNWLLNQRVGKLFNIDKSKVNIAFLKYILVSEPINEYYKKLGRGGLQINIGKQDILNAKIPLPPLPEQQRIVSILDEAFSVIERSRNNAEQNLKNAKELFESCLIKVFYQGVNEKNWKLEKLEKYNKVVVGYVGPISKEYTNSEDGVLLLSTKNINDKGITLDKLTRINHQFHLKNKKSQLSSGDILVARHGNSGQSAVIPETIKSAHALNVIVIKKGEKMYSKYISFLLNSGVMDKIASSKAGSVQEIINTSVIKDLVIPVPSLEEQQTIVRQLDALRAETQKLEAVYQKKLDDLEELKKIVLRKAFGGEL